jgi:hypothetical protein
MRRSGLAISALTSIAFLGPPALAQSFDCGDLRNTGRPGQLYMVSAAAQNSPRWVPLPSAVTSSGGYERLTLAYIVPVASRGQTGSLLVKIARQSSVSQSEQAASNLRIRLTRRAVTTTCKGRYASDYVKGLFDDLIRPDVQTDVGVADYIYYHKTDSDSGQTEIYGFHYEYRDKAGRCISTDDKRNGNRQQFLYVGRERDNSLVVANVKDNLGLVARAIGAPDYLEKLLEDKRARELLTGYLKYRKLETQLHHYKHPESTCVAFPVADIEKGEMISLSLNNLEQRDARGRLLPASSRKEKSTSVQIR